MIVMVAREQGKDETPPQFEKIPGNVVAESTDAVSQQRVRTRITLRQSQEGHCGNEWDTMGADAIEAGDHGDILSTYWYEPVLRHLNTRVSGEFECEDFTRRDPCCGRRWEADC